MGKPSFFDARYDGLPLPLRWRLVLVAVVPWLLAGADLSRLTGLWPCDIACQGGAHYQTVMGVSVIWPALFAHVVLGLLGVRDLRRGGWCPWTVRLLWFHVGVSAFFAMIATHLGLACPYCATVHLGLFLLMVLAMPFSPTVRWWQVLAWVLTGWLATNAVFHHTPVADSATPSGTTTAPVDVDVSLAANRGRTYGDPSAAKTLEVIIDLTCTHCAEQYRPLMTALKPALAAKRVRVVVRHLARPSQAASTPAAELALAAAVLGEHAAALEVLLGSNPDSGPAGLTARVAEVIDPAKLDVVMKKDIETLRTVLGDDQSRVLLLGTGPRTPAAVLLEDGKVIKRWVGDLPVTAITAALDGAL